MAIKKTTFRSVDEYIAEFSPEIRELLETIRLTIMEAAPQAEEVISYNMPAYRQNGILVYFAAGKEHIGFYPTPGPIVYFRDELKGYKTSKGAIQFPIEKNIPKGLVRKIVKYRIKEDTEKAASKKKK